MKETRRVAAALALAGTLSLAYGALALGATKTKTFNTGTIAAPIADQDVLVQTIKVRKKGKLKDANVDVRADHPVVEDLSLLLLSPRGKLVTLMTNPVDVPDPDLGSGSTSCSGSFLTFDDQASEAVETADSPLDGSFRPDEPLSTLGRKSIKGKWRLLVVDGDGSDEGTLYCAQLELKYKAMKRR